MSSYVLLEDQGENSSSASLNQQEDSKECPENQEHFLETRRSVGFVLQEEGGQQMRTSSVVRSTELTLMKRRAALQKLRMEKMIGSGGPPSSMNFHRVVAHHSNSEANDSRLDRQNDAMNMSVASRRPRSSNFTLEETFDLLKIWASPEMQWQMKYNCRNFRVWEAISYSMHELGHDRTAIQCKNRVQNLTTIFYRIRKSKQDYRTFNFPYYKLMSEVLDKKMDETTAIAVGMAGPIELNPALAKFATKDSDVHGNSNGGMNNSHCHSDNSSNNPGRMTAEMSFVDPETSISSFTDHNSSSSSNGSSNMNVFCPDVCLIEGNSPIRVEAQGSASWSSASKPRANDVTAMSFLNRISGNGTTCAGGSLKLEQEDKVTITVEEGSLPSEDEQDIEASDYDCDESPSRNGGLRLHPRSFSSSFITSPCYVKPEYGRGMPVGNTAKRPRIASTATATNASSTMDDPFDQYLVETVNIERQLVEMERERDKNERATRMCMLQILQAIVCPNRSKDEEDANEGRRKGMKRKMEKRTNSLKQTKRQRITKSGK